MKERRVFIAKTYLLKFHTPNFKQRQYSEAGLENILRNHPKVILRHSNLLTERYLGKISDVESMKWIESVCLTVKSQEEVNNVFTLMNIHIAIQKMKISATSKSFDMSDRPELGPGCI